MARKYARAASKKVESAMKKRAKGTLRSGGNGRKVKSRKQAIAIALSEARRSGEKVPPNPSRKTKSAAKTGRKTSARKNLGRKTAGRKSSARKSSSRKSLASKSSASKSSASRSSARKSSARKSTKTAKRRSRS
jgi:hypothetical protein